MLQLSKSKSIGQTQDIETTTVLAQNDSLQKTSEPSTDTETACEPTPQPPLRQTDTTSTLETNDPTTEDIPQKEHSLSRGGRYNLRLNLNPNYSEKKEISMCVKIYSSPFPVLFSFSNFFPAHIFQLLLDFLYFLGANPYNYQKTMFKKKNKTESIMHTR